MTGQHAGFRDRAGSLERQIRRDQMTPKRRRSADAPARAQTATGAAHASQAERQRSFAGAQPEALLGPNPAALLGEFLDYMGEMGYPGARRLRNEYRLPFIDARRGSNGSDIRGYRLGLILGEKALAQCQLDRKTVRVTSESEVLYVCTDGLMRSGTIRTPAGGRAYTDDKGRGTYAHTLPVSTVGKRLVPGEFGHTRTIQTSSYSRWQEAEVPGPTRRIDVLHHMPFDETLVCLAAVSRALIPEQG